MPKVVFVVGPTASGKSALALDLAQRFDGAIINADSIQMYQNLDIGSAKPTAEEMNLVPHYLFGFAKAPETVTVGDFHRKFFELIETIPQDLAFVVGGTGFYFQALEKGLPKIPAARPDFQGPYFKKWAADPASAREDHEFLKSRDPQSAARIHFNDHYRLARALDIMDATGKSVTDVWQDHGDAAPQFPYSLLKIGFRASREDLEERVRLRTREMLSKGMLNEVERLLQQGFENWDPLFSVGYKQVRDALLKGGEPDLEALEKDIVQQTLKLAKKQRTWFQRDPEIHWLQFRNLPNHFKENLTQARELVQNFRA